MVASRSDEKPTLSPEQIQLFVDTFPQFVKELKTGNPEAVAMGRRMLHSLADLLRHDQLVLIYEHMQENVFKTLTKQGKL